MGYLSFYNMVQEPFSVIPLPQFYYHSDQHDQALVRLQRAAQGMKGLALLVGDVGTGKTMLARRLLDSLPEEQYEAGMLVIIHAEVDSKWLVKKIALQLGVEDPPDDRMKLSAVLVDRLSTIAQAGRKAVILIDEAQMLRQQPLMEELRGLLNLELPEQKLITFLLFGLPELDAVVGSDPPLAQRVAVRYVLESFNLETTAHYIEHRLNLAGRTEPLFTAESVALIHQQSKGVPRLTNVICDNALFEGFMRQLPLITPDIIKRVTADLGL